MAGQVWVKKVDYKGMKVTMVESQRVGKLRIRREGELAETIWVSEKNMEYTVYLIPDPVSKEMDGIRIHDFITSFL